MRRIILDLMLIHKTAFVNRIECQLRYLAGHKIVSSSFERDSGAKFSRLSRNLKALECRVVDSFVSRRQILHNKLSSQLSSSDRTPMKPAEASNCINKLQLTEKGRATDDMQID